MIKKFNRYTFTDEKGSIDLEKVCSMLHSSYWASNRSIEKIKMSIENSICVSVLNGTELIAFARVVTDKATFSWIADVIVDENHRGKGIGKEIMSFIQDHPDVPDTVQLLATKDAHGLYEKFGFTNDQCMIKRN